MSSLDEKYLKVYFRRPIQPVAKEAVELFEKLASNTLHEGSRAHSLPTEDSDKHASGYYKYV